MLWFEDIPNNDSAVFSKDGLKVAVLQNSGMYNIYSVYNKLLTINVPPAGVEMELNK